jgi:hypothetical protein
LEAAFSGALFIHSCWLILLEMQIIGTAACRELCVLK